MFKNRSILVTGGTGSFGKAFIKGIIKKYPNFKRLVIFSRDELKQFEMSNQKDFQHPNIRMFIGDIRDKERLKRALEGIEFVVHAAALKQVPTAEYNPFEFIKTNIIGTQNLVEACIDSRVKKVIALSTDKASSPINLYGATKLCSDKLILSANNIKGSRDISFSVVRYGNVMGSRGSVIPLFLNQRKKNIFTITDRKMTRFNITLEEGVNFVLNSLKIMRGGEIFVPKIPSYKIIDLVNSVSKNPKIKIIGIRPGEKIHEEMISSEESLNVVEYKNFYVVIPNSKFNPINKKKYMEIFKDGKNTKENFNYSSNNNVDFLTVSQLTKLIQKNIQDFEI